MKYELKTLENGIRFLEVPVADARSVTVLVLFHVGSRNESPQINGLSHFLEHMFFKGTPKRPKAEMISEAVDSVGGEMNAFTSKEFTGYYIKAAGKHGPLAAEVLADMLQNSLFAAEEIDRERGVITEEIKMYEDQPMAHVGELFEEVLFGATPLGRQVIGTRQNIARLKRQEFVTHKNNFYNTANMVLVVAGDTKSAKLSALKHFASFPIGTPPKLGDGQATNESSQRYHMQVKKTEQTHLWLGFPGVGLDHPDRYALRVLSAVLGGGMSSRLFLSVRERRGLAYYVRCQTEYYTDNGFIAASAGVTSDKFAEAVEAILNEFNLITREPLSAKELAKAKEYLKGKLLLSMEQSDSLGELLGMQLVLGQELATPEEINKKIDMVTIADVQRVAKKYLTSESLRASVISSIDYGDWLDHNLHL